MKELKLFLIVLLAFTTKMSEAQTKAFKDDIKSVQVTANNDWLSPPVINLNSSDVINIGFDQLSHNYHRYTYRIEHCEADWSISDQIFQSDYLNGLNDNTIENYTNSINTVIDYTHYSLQIPNGKCSLKMSGNYRVSIFDDDNGGEKVLQAEFMVVEPVMNIGMNVTTNTDIDLNKNHQQLSVELNYGNINITDYDEQIRTVFMQNGRYDNARHNLKPSIINNRGVKWTYNRDLIFTGDNEYRKYEILDVSHPTMGIDHISWDGHNYNAYPFADEPRKNYIYDEDANGYFFIRNSDNIEIDYTCEYVYVHYIFKSPEINKPVYVTGKWTTDYNTDAYLMKYDQKEQVYHTTILQKQGYYSYQYMAEEPDGSLSITPLENSFYQTENRYQVLVYYKATGDRTWKLTGYRQTVFK